MCYVSPRKEYTLKATEIITTIITTVKDILHNHIPQLEQPLTLENAEDVLYIIKTAALAAGAEGFKTYLEQNETRENTLVHKGQQYRFSRTSKKEFQTPLGTIVLTRRLYQNEVGESFVPLDCAWNMENQFAASEVRDAVLFAVSLIPAHEAHQLFGKCSTFNIAESSFKKVAENLGPDLEKHIGDFLETIRQEEAIPAEEAKVCAVSMDGANVLLQEPGKKKGHKRQRPGERKKAAEGSFDSPASYKNATVGSVTLYGAVPAGERAPERLQSRYLARMPEDKATTLKKQLEREAETTLSRLPPNVTGIFLSDAAQGIRKEIDTNPLFADFEKIIDYFHTTEHLSNAAEAIWGKDHPDGKTRYESKRGQLLEDENGAEQVYRSLLYYQHSYKYPKARRDALRREVTFFKNNKDRMEYARYRRNGWPIGSGVIEAACKSIVKCRCCRSGMRWTRAGGQVILTLRSILKSGRWDDFWTLCKNARFAKINKIAT